MDAKKKIAHSLLTMFSMILIVVFALVLTLSMQNIRNNASADSFKAYGVAATVSGNYYVGNNSFKMKSGENDKIVFNSYDEESSPSLDQTEPICLTSTNDYVIFEYKFENNSSNVSFVANISNIIEVENMDITYGFSYTQLKDYSKIKFNQIDSVPVINGKGNCLYYYIKVKVSDLNKHSALNGNFNFCLIAEDVYTIRLIDGFLNNKTYAALGYPVNSVNVPEMKGYKFKGYYTGLNGSGEMIFDENGDSTKIWDKDKGATLFAHYTKI